LDNEVRDDPSIINLHERPVGIEDADDPHVNTVLTLIGIG